MTTTQTAQLTIRLSTADDDDALTRLAQLDSAQPLAATTVLVAEEDGNLVAARSLTDGAVIANPFRHTASTVALLEARASELAGSVQAPRRGGLRRILRPALARA